MSIDSRGVRAQLEAILEKDLLGPWGGEDEDLVGEGPRSRYLVGFLAPQGVHTSAEDVDASGLLVLLVLVSAFRIV